MPVAEQDLKAKCRIAVRGIIRDWYVLRSPLPVDEIVDDPSSDDLRFRIRGSESLDALQARVVEFAGRVWQLKDGLIRWLQLQPTIKIKMINNEKGLSVDGTGGKDAARFVEEIAVLCIPLLLCADLYNTYKHYADCNRSGFQPVLNGVSFNTSKSGCVGLNTDPVRMTSDITVRERVPVQFHIELRSRNQPITFGDAIVGAGKAFLYWIPLIRSIKLFSGNDPIDKAILDDLAIIERDIQNADPYEFVKKPQ